MQHTAFPSAFPVFSPRAVFIVLNLDPLFLCQAFPLFYPRALIANRPQGFDLFFLLTF